MLNYVDLNERLLYVIEQQYYINSFYMWILEILISIILNNSQTDDRVPSAGYSAVTFTYNCI